MVAVDMVTPNPAQPRRNFLETDLCSLAESISENGLIQPIIVRKVDGKYILIAGERRLRAAKIAGITELPALITECNTRESAALAIIENLERRDLTIFEEAFSIYSLIKEWGLTQEETSRRLGMSQSTLANKLRLLRLSPQEQKIIEENKLTERHARALIRLESREARLQVISSIISKGLNVKKTEELIERVINPKKKQTCKGFVSGDIRLFINTIDHAVSTMITAGIYAKAERKETEEYIECIVRIPKPQVIRQRKAEE